MVVRNLLRPIQTNAGTLYLCQRQRPNDDGEESSGPPKKPMNKSSSSLKITLMQNQNVSVTSLEEAKNLAKRRSMHLVQVQKLDTKTQRPVYKLVSSAERLQEELSDLKGQDKDEKTPQKKSEKTLNIGSRISDHDLASRLKNISKWLAKSHEVRILIQGNESELPNCEKIYKTIEESIKTPEVIGKIVQKRIKGSVIKFNILPIVNKENSTITNQ
ncbi:translation initiation factor IF-3 [Musca vetustissima]|uniref:translation initiation factor IF-3 n=1 Tax=Musca vetustissima TaxID=27455 RepID=UPI002AB74167|nr:translation initiation factor IF-3 [Musca vetustissima]